MEKTTNIYEKLNQARKIIRETPIKKEGFNDYGKYEFFTPSQIEELVAKACEATKTMCLCNLKQDQFGYYQTLDFISLESSKEENIETGWGEKLSFELRTERPDITATNASQKMGGMDTFSERYIKMKVFTIRDNNLDFDSQNNTEDKSGIGKGFALNSEQKRKIRSSADQDPGYEENKVIEY